ncbi:Hypothetical predicted protein, partial [Pelobates cultripes]
THSHSCKQNLKMTLKEKRPQAGPQTHEKDLADDSALPTKTPCNSQPTTTASRGDPTIPTPRSEMEPGKVAGIRSAPSEPHPPTLLRCNPPLRHTAGHPSRTLTGLCYPPKGHRLSSAKNRRIPQGWLWWKIKMPADT